LDLAKANDTCWRRHIVKTLAENRIRGNMLYFVQNFMENRSFRVVLGEETSRKLYFENGVVMSDTLFLVAMAEITYQIRQPVEIVRYADDWAIFTSDQDMETAETNMQTALNSVAKWTRQKRI
jgi:hypothetical protein